MVTLTNLKAIGNSSLMTFAIQFLAPHQLGQVLMKPIVDQIAD